jgi:hypothetical protein
LQLKSLAAPNSDEQQHLVEALIGMERVAEHINEMQRIHEEYGAIFDHLFRQHQKTSKQVGHGGSFNQFMLMLTRNFLVKNVIHFYMNLM